MSDDPDIDSDHPSQMLPQVTSFEECTQNFNTMSTIVHTLVSEIREEREYTRAQMSRISDDANTNMAKISSDTNAILSSQSMMLMICLIVVTFIVLGIKALIESIESVYHLIQ